MIKLKPCPFCGGEPKRLWDYESDTHEVLCANRECHMAPKTDWYVKDFDIKLWNTRAKPASAGEGAG